MNHKPAFWVRTLPNTPGDELVPGLFIHTLAKDQPTLSGSLSVYHMTQEVGLSRLGELKSHAEAEFIFPITGSLEIQEPSQHRGFGTPSLLYIPAWCRHEVQSGAAARAEFFTLKLLTGSAARQADEQTEIVLHRFDESVGAKDYGELSEVGSIWLETTNPFKLRIMRIKLEGCRGYPPHAHEHDLLLLLMRGRHRGLGYDVQAPAAFYFPAGCLHSSIPVPESGEFMAIEIHGQ